jgi:hypothetical protein
MGLKRKMLRVKNVLYIKPEQPTEPPTPLCVWGSLVKSSTQKIKIEIPHYSRKQCKLQNFYSNNLLELACIPLFLHFDVETFRPNALGTICCQFAACALPSQDGFQAKFIL